MDKNWAESTENIRCYETNSKHIKWRFRHFVSGSFEKVASAVHASRELQIACSVASFQTGLLTDWLISRTGTSVYYAPICICNFTQCSSKNERKRTHKERFVVVVLTPWQRVWIRLFCDCLIRLWRCESSSQLLSKVPLWSNILARICFTFSYTICLSSISWQIRECDRCQFLRNYHAGWIINYNI